MKPQRFTLRKEYFGGLVYDAKTMAVEILNPDEYEFLAAITKRLKFASTYPETCIDFFIQKGFINHKNGKYTSPSMRFVPPPKYIRKGVLSAPIRVFDSYTRRCNFQCEHCYFTSSAFVKETRRTIEQTKDIIRKFYESGTMEWRFTGGEALIMVDLFEAVAYAKSLGMNVGIYSNGWWVDSIAQKVFASGIDEVVLSLEGSREINDKRRRVGGFDKVLETVERIYRFNTDHPDRTIHGVIATAVGRDNVRDVPFLARLAAKYKFTINFMPLKPSGRARYALSNEMLNPAEYMAFAKTVQNLREEDAIKKSGIKIILKYKDLFCESYEDKSDKPFPFNYAECGALTKYISMMPDGRVFSCPFILDVDPTGKYLGPNMIDASVEDAWNNPNFESYRAADKIGCTDCKFYMKQCRGKCRATVLGYGGKIANGKLIGDDPQCFAPLL